METMAKSSTSPSKITTPRSLSQIEDDSTPSTPDAPIDIPSFIQYLTYDEFYPFQQNLPFEIQPGKLDLSNLVGPEQPLFPITMKSLSLNLDITRITNRVIACGLLTDKQTNKDLHQNNVKDIRSFMDSRYKQKYMVWNLAGNNHMHSYIMNDKCDTYSISISLDLIC